MSLNRRLLSNQSGVTLVELVISITIISIAIVAILTAFSGSMGRSADPLWRNKTMKLAQLYLDEILSKPYDDSTPLGGVPASTTADRCVISDEGQARAEYDDVDDYDVITNALPSSLTGNMDSYAQYRVSISVSCSGNGVNATSNQDAKLITVTITPPNQLAMSFSVYRGNF